MKIFNFWKRKKQKKNITTPSLNTLLKEVPKTLQQYVESKNNAEQMVINLFFYAETYKTGQKFAEKLEKLHLLLHSTKMHQAFMKSAVPRLLCLPQPETLTAI